MDESIRALATDPRGVEVASRLADIVSTARYYANHPEMPAHRKVSAILRMLDEQCPAPANGDGQWEGAIPPGTTAAQAAILLASYLSGHPDPVTGIAQRWLGETVWIRTDQMRSWEAGEGDGPFEDDLRRRLRANYGDRFWWRSGWMAAEGSGVVVAATELTLLPGRLGDLATGLGDLPFGTLAGSRLSRRARAAWPYPGLDPAVESAALLTLDNADLACGAVRERFTAGFLEHAVRLAAAPAGASRILHAAP